MATILARIGAIKDETMADPTLKEWTLPGAPRSLFMLARTPITVKIVTHSNTTNQIVRMPKKGAVGHDTGNPSTITDALASLWAAIRALFTKG